MTDGPFARSNRSTFEVGECPSPGSTGHQQGGGGSGRTRRGNDLGVDASGSREGERRITHTAAIDRSGIQGLQQWRRGGEYVPVDQVVDAGQRAGCGHQ